MTTPDTIHCWNLDPFIGYGVLDLDHVEGQLWEQVGEEFLEHFEADEIREDAATIAAFYSDDHEEPTVYAPGYGWECI